MIRKIDFSEDLLPLLEAEAKRLKTTLSGLINMHLSGLSPAPIRPVTGPATASAPITPGPDPAPREAVVSPNPAPVRPQSGPNPAPGGDIEGGESLGGGEEQVGRTARKSRKSRTDDDSRPGDPPGFREFWKAYPRKKGRINAVAQWKRTGPVRPPLAEILGAIERQAGCDRWQRGYILDPERWLKGGHWADECEEQPNGHPEPRPAPPPLNIDQTRNLAHVMIGEEQIHGRMSKEARRAASEAIQGAPDPAAVQAVIVGLGLPPLRGVGA